MMHLINKLFSIDKCSSSQDYRIRQCLQEKLNENNINLRNQNREVCQEYLGYFQCKLQIMNTECVFVFIL